MFNLIRVLVGAVVIGALTGSASADFVSILNVDFNNDSPTTAAVDGNGVGFQGFNISDAPVKTFTGLNSRLTSGSVSVTLSNIDGWRDRGYFIPGGSLSGSFNDLYRDFVAFTSSSNNFVTAMTLAGLNPNTNYSVTIQSFDWEINSSLPPPLSADTRIRDVTPGGATNGLTTDAYFITTVDPSASITDFSNPAGASGSFTVRSNSSGTLVIALADGGGQQGFPRINGFELAAPQGVPEPSSLALACLGGLLGLGARWRHRRRPA